MTRETASPPAAAEPVRLDKWLWAARFFKTRSQAAQAVDGGKIDVNGERAKRARLVQLGDLIRVGKGMFDFHVLVRGLSELRGPAKTATALYEETPESKAAREQLAYQLKNAPALTYLGRGRPTKRNRRDIDKLKRF